MVTMDRNGHPGSGLSDLFSRIPVGDRLDVSRHSEYRPVSGEASTLVKAYLGEYHPDFSYNNPGVEVNGQLERLGFEETAEGFEAALARETKTLLTELYEAAAPYLHPGVKDVDRAVERDWQAIQRGVEVTPQDDGTFRLAYAQD